MSCSSPTTSCIYSAKIIITYICCSSKGMRFSVNGQLARITNSFFQDLICPSSWLLLYMFRQSLRFTGSMPVVVYQLDNESPEGLSKDETRCTVHLDQSLLFSLAVQCHCSVRLLQNWPLQELEVRQGLRKIGCTGTTVPAALHFGLLRRKGPLDRQSIPQRGVERSGVL